MKVCPSCSGAKKAYLHMHKKSGGHQSGWVDCSICEGKGEIDDAHYERWSVGRMVRDARRSAKLTPTECAVRLGVPETDMLGIEFGRIYPPVGWRELLKETKT